MGRSEKRKYERLAIRLDLSCRKVSSAKEGLHRGRTVNASPGGLYFETAAETLNRGDVLTVELSIPPTTGLLESGGRLSTLARVVRTGRVCGSVSGGDRSSGRRCVAVEFCQPPRLCM